MPAQPMLNAMAETIINQALKADPDAKNRLQPVRGKIFRLRLRELPWPVTILFCEDHLVLLGEPYESVDGEVDTSLAVLGSLRDAAKVTAAIQRKEVKLSGDPIFAQQASKVVLGLNIDWEEALAERFGDVAGYWLYRGILKLDNLRPDLTQWRGWLSDTLTEEKKLLPGQLEYAIFCDDLRDLEHRLTVLEANRAQNEDT